jgi:chemotaxis protein MotB
VVRHRRFSIAVLVAGLIVSGCVSTSEFKKMEEGKNQEISALKQEKTSLEQQKGELESQKVTLEKGIAELKQQNSSLEQEKASMAVNNQQTQKQYEELVQGLSKEVKKGELQVKQYKNMLSMNLESRIFFDSGKVTLRKEGKAILKKYENKIIRVVGHTDNVPVAKSLRATFPSNWDLSVARAANVVRYLQEVGVPPERMLAAGRAEYDPVASNDTPGGRQKNRRIEIMLLDKSLVSEMTRTSN